MNEMPDCPTIKHCHCFPEQEAAANLRGETHCVCGESEKALRAWVNNRAPAPMTDAQREWCLSEIDQVEGYSSSDYRSVTDRMLAMGVLSAWQAFCQDKGLS